MSGIEIAGLVLGAFPILIYALESYREGAEGLVDWWQIKRAYTRCRQDLTYHQLMFEGNVERLLSPLVVDDDELKSLMADPAGQAWEDKELEERLKARLPKSYKLFLEIMGDINKLMESLKKELGINNASFQAKVDQDYKLIKPNTSRHNLMSASNMEFQAKRVKFTLKKSNRQRLFAKLQEANDRMRNLLQSSDETTIARRNRQPVKYGTHNLVNRTINEFWRHAKRLHEALSKAWQCGCASHQANLALKHRASDTVEFEILFHVGKWQQTKIKMVPNTQCLPTTPAMKMAAQSALPSTSQNPRQVRWIEPNVQTIHNSTERQLNKIHDLCSVLSKSCPGCFGFLDDDDNRFILYPGSQDLPAAKESTVTLEKIMQSAHTLSRRKRYFLALTLASSYLQLGSTPWLDAPLKKEHIVFLHDPVDPESAVIDQPYICREMSAHNSTSSNENIVTLGIRLLELCFGAPLETYEFRKKLPAGDEASAPMLDLAAAMQWSKAVGEEAGPEFAEAIDWCLHAKQASDGSWRKEIWSNVIVPLDACHKQVSQRVVVT